MITGKRDTPEKFAFMKKVATKTRKQINSGILKKKSNRMRKTSSSSLDKKEGVLYDELFQGCLPRRINPL